MKKLISIAMALLLAAGVAGAQMTDSGMPEKPMMKAGQMPGGEPPEPRSEAPTQPPPETDGQEMMGMVGMGQAIMPNMMNMMMARSPLAAGKKTMRMPMMGPMMQMGMGAMPWMMNGSAGETAATLEKFRAFLKETKNARKELHDLCFAYFEASWAPETTVKQLQDMSLKMRKLQEEIMAKMPK